MHKSMDAWRMENRSVMIEMHKKNNCPKSLHQLITMV